MSRRRVSEKRVILPDPKYHNETVAKFINHVMVSGKKAVAERIVYGALDIVQKREDSDPLEIFVKALEEVAPITEVKSRRVGGSTLPVPIEVRPSRRTALRHAMACRQCASSQRKDHGIPSRERTD